MERVALTAFIWLSSSLYKSWRHQHFTLWFVLGNIKYAQMGWGEEDTSLTAPPSHLRFDQEQTAAAPQSLCCGTCGKRKKKPKHAGVNMYKHKGKKNPTLESAERYWACLWRVAFLPYFPADATNRARLLLKTYTELEISFKRLLLLTIPPGLVQAGHIQKLFHYSCRMRKTCWRGSDKHLWG